MATTNRYLTRQTLFPPLIHETPAQGLGLIVVIPCFNEPNLLASLTALAECERPSAPVEVIVVINQASTASEAISRQNQQSFDQALAFSREQASPSLRIFPLLLNDLLPKTAGVGLARKIGMDEAVYRFETAGNAHGVIACFDADARCAPNYLAEVERYFRDNPSDKACSIYYEHPLDGKEYSPAVYDGIVLYELYLRYYRQAMAWAGHPHACQTVGSSMAVRVDAYQAQGGMNKRKAGEDFYFLHKFSVLGALGELLTTRVIPSPRASDRVPFGTGKAIGAWLGRPNPDWPTFDLRIFEELRVFIERVATLYSLPHASWKSWQDQLPTAIGQYLTQQDWENKVLEVRENCGVEEHFLPRFFRWFNALQVLKYAHFARDHYYPDQPVAVVAKQLLEKVGEWKGEEDAWELLIKYRVMAKKGVAFGKAK